MKVEYNAYIQFNQTQSLKTNGIMLGKPITGVLFSNGDTTSLKYGSTLFKLLNVDFPIFKGSEEVLFYPTHYEKDKLYIKIIDLIDRKGTDLIKSQNEAEIASKLLEDIGLKNNEHNLINMLKIIHGKQLGQDYYNLKKDQIEILYRLNDVFSVFQTGYKDNLPVSLIKIENYKTSNVKQNKVTELNIFYDSPSLGLINIKINYNLARRNLDITFNAETTSTLDLLHKNRYRIEPLLKSMGFGVKLHYINGCSYNSIFDFIFINTFNEKV